MEKRAMEKKSLECLEEFDRVKEERQKKQDHSK